MEMFIKVAFFNAERGRRIKGIIKSTKEDRQAGLKLNLQKKNMNRPDSWATLLFGDIVFIRMAHHLKHSSLAATIVRLQSLFFLVAKHYEFSLCSESFHFSLAAKPFPHSKVSNNLLSRTVLCFDWWGDEAATTNCVNWKHRADVRAGNGS